MPANNTRPAIATIQKKANVSTEEAFQNMVIRPIIKMKHDLFIDYLRDYLMAKKEPLNGLNIKKKIIYLESVFQHDINLRSELRGVVLGQFTTAEYLQYVKMKHEINKRMINILMKRMIDHIDKLTN